MENEHTIFGLIRKRAEMAGQLIAIQETARKLTLDIEALDTTLRIFQPDIELSSIRAKKMPTYVSARAGEMQRIIFTALREKHGQTVHQLAEAVATGMGIEMTDKAVKLMMRKRVSQSLINCRKRGVLESRWDGPKMVWSLAV